MKRFYLLIIICLCLVGCVVPEKTTDKFSEQFKNYENKLIQHKNFETSSNEFSIKLILNKVTETQTRYDIIIDSPKINMYYLQAIAKVENDNQNSLPTLGILETEKFSLLPGVVDKNQDIYRGVNLSGITEEKEISVVVYLTFYNDKNKNEKQERFLRLSNDTIR